MQTQVIVLKQVCASAYIYGRIINTVNLPKNHYLIARIITAVIFFPKIYTGRLQFPAHKSHRKIIFKCRLHTETEFCSMHSDLKYRLWLGACNISYKLITKFLQPLVSYYTYTQVQVYIKWRCWLPSAKSNGMFYWLAMSGLAKYNRFCFL